MKASHFTSIVMVLCLALVPCGNSAVANDGDSLQLYPGLKPPADMNAAEKAL